VFVPLTLFEWCELEVTDEIQQLLVRRWLPELPIGTSGVKLPASNQLQ
jgi:hypothetical protein